jgi:dephospho-CoA kinase|tara:strand:+ start:1081 stop:1638 length:558 start_codon:yes stop_codon:yes gene_type:complete
MYYIIGLTGRNASGKGTVADLLKKRNFIYHSLSDTLREELSQQKMEESRENLIFIGNSLRSQGGPGVLADLMVKNLITPNNHIVDSIRNPSEVHSLRSDYLEHKFVLISIDADPRTRFERLVKRDRKGDSNSWEQFVAQEKLEEASEDPNKQQLFNTIKEADFNINNSGNLIDLENKLSSIIDNL